MPRSLPIRVCAPLLLVVFAAPAAAQPAEQINVVAPGAGGGPTGTTILGAADIGRSGASTIGSVLDALPAFGSQGVNGAQNDDGFGEYFIDLRNLNFDRTLVLVDGKRFVPSGIRTDEAVDLNNIPAAFVDHIEILRDGTQPQYAADAVAGVVNVVLKDQIEGIHLDTYGAAAGAGDAGTAEATLTAGHGFADGHVALGLDFFIAILCCRATARGPPTRSRAPPARNGCSAAQRRPGGHAVGDGIDAVAIGNGQARPYNAAADNYNFAPYRYLQGGLQRATVYVDADAVLSDRITANAELLFSDRSATTLLPPQTLGLTGTTKHPDGFMIPASDQFNPFGAPVTLERVVSEAGAQETTTGGPVWRVLGGLDGAHGSWDWSLSFDHGQSLSRYDADNQINLTRALQIAGNGPCLLSEGCTEADWFGSGSLSPQALAYIGYTGKSQSAYTETVGQARVGGPLFALPGGEARLALGGEVRSQFGSTTVDAVTARGDQAGNDAAPTSGGYNTYEAYATLTAPLLHGMKLANWLDLSLSARATGTSRYGGFGTYRAAIDYAPVAGLTLRAVSGIARRPPAISEAFGGITASPQPVTDPCAQNSGLRGNPVVNANCLSQGLGAGFMQASPLIDVESGGNPALHPEQSENELLGATLAPPAWPFLTASIDWYHYRVRDAIDSLADTDPNLIPDACYESVRLASPLCALITRVPGGGNEGQISNIVGLDENVGTIKTDGVDFGLTATPPETPLGQVRLDWQTTWLLDYRLRTLGQNGFTQYAGTFPGLAAVGSYARVRSRATADLQHGAWSFGWTTRFISGARVLGAAPGDPYGKAPGILYHDVTVSRRIGRLTAMAGIDNLADQRPPTLIDGETNTDTSTYDVVGRLIWAHLTYAF
jgi:iron complex outermembrane receptor protein